MQRDIFMRKLKIETGILLIILLFGLHIPKFVYADVEWSLKKQFNLDVAPVDISTSLDGQWVYVLAPGEILIYSLADSRIVNRFPVEKGFDKLAFAAQDGFLILSSSTEKTLKIIQLETVNKFDFVNLSFKGYINAPVTIAVFSDYQ